MPLAEINITNLTTEVPYEYQNKELNLYYAVCEVLVAIFAVVGNALVIYVFQKDRKLRRRTNYYIVSLATADFLVGLLGIPFAILSSVGLPTNLHACLFTVSLLVVLCTISIFCLVAVSVDRYWAILHPMGYSRNVRTKTALEKRSFGKHLQLEIMSLCYAFHAVNGPEDAAGIKQQTFVEEYD
ncbi:hypothetical protein NQ317_006523 [Molorchus minor]|uniref:G-protein coupled receptors family 1 profile domain-containing protein n=1 Tax=Molorchus minor TaxID=1323400 RepID=A0ABQ9IVP3_9CUCU|nr:hypothetical protein NQ317_006523 [Molorchus minor]